MSEDIKVVAKQRESKGTNAVKRLRSEGWIPAVVYSSKRETMPIQVNEHDFELMLGKHGSESMMMGLEIEGGQSTQVLLKEVQHHPVDGHVLHVDFHAVAMDETLQVAIPVELLGEPKGVVEGGVLDHILREIEVECLPADIVEQFEVDVSELDVNDSVTVGDMEIDRNKYKVMVDEELAIAAVVPPRKTEEEIEEEEGVLEEGAAEPEVIGEEEAEEGTEEEPETEE